MKASVFYRIAAVLLLLFAIGHTVGFRQVDPRWGVDGLIASMQSIHFEIQGFSRTHRDFFVGFGLFVTVFLLFAGGVSVADGGTSGADFGAHARHWLGARFVLCRDHGFEREIFLWRPDCFFNPDYDVFDCCRVALRERGAATRGVRSQDAATPSGEQISRTGGSMLLNRTPHQSDSADRAEETESAATNFRTAVGLS
jgi:hypothetical protein